MTTKEKGEIILLAKRWLDQQFGVGHRVAVVLETPDKILLAGDQPADYWRDMLTELANTVPSLTCKGSNIIH